MEENKANIFKPKTFSASVKNSGLNDFIFLIDLKEDTCSVSESCAKFIQVPSANFPNATKTLASLVHQDDIGIFNDCVDQIKKGSSHDFILECRMKSPSNTYIPISFRAKSVSLPNGQSLLTGTICLKSSRHDDITGLPLEAQMIHDYNEARRSQGSVSGFILAIRIEGLEHINANFGLEVGDNIFNIVAKACIDAQKDQTRAYRISGNKIALLNIGGGTATDAQGIYQSLKRRIGDIEFDLDYSVVFTISAGIVAFINDMSELKDLIKKADFSLSMGRKCGKNNLYFFNNSEYSKHINRLDLHEKLRESVKDNFKGFEIYYQPVIDATEFDPKTGGQKVHVIGAEALLRWGPPNSEKLPADQVIPVLEETGLMAPVGRWILMKAFNQCHVWNQFDKNFHMSVNLSYVQLERSDILFDVECALEKTKVNPENITLEITESGYIDHDELQRLFDELHKLKINIDIDDFGTGYSNLRYIQNLHANTLKLDYSFVQKAVRGKDGDSERRVIEHIINMAHDLGMKVCLEGIESENDVEILSKLKPDKFQGFFFGKPVSSYAFLDRNKQYFRDNAPQKSDEPEEIS
ncbi:MAG: GGDEF domain-containing phosphodiesterase [Treponema sp.]|nr:GGDEF domain-containing phosphodiesterase [Treponema sp.]MEE3434012.1 GGDEF domain-containing phosphodiesterase [Treponema sp.]